MDTTLAPVRYAGRIGHGLHTPAGLAVGRRRLWVADTEGQRVQVYDLHGHRVGVLGDGVLREPRDVAVHDGWVFVADSARGSVEAFDERGHHRAAIGRGELVEPRGVAVDGTGRLLISDVGNNRVAVADPARRAVTGWITENVHIPYGIAADPSGTGFWLVSSSRQYDGDCGVTRFVDDKPTTTDKPTIGLGQHSKLGFMSNPAFCAIDRSGRVLVTVPDYGFVQRFLPDGTFVDEFGTQGAGLLRQPLGIELAPDGSVLVADRGNRRVVRFEEQS